MRILTILPLMNVFFDNGDAFPKRRHWIGKAINKKACFAAFRRETAKGSP
jgi:hypothetical protein